MINPDLFVGTVAIALGLFVSLSAVFNWDWYYQLHKARWIESICGRSGARVFFGVLGLVLIVLGAAIASGMLSGSSRNGGSKSSAKHSGGSDIKLYVAGQVTV